MVTLQNQTSLPAANVDHVECCDSDKPGRKYLSTSKSFRAAFLLPALSLRKLLVPHGILQPLTETDNPYGCPQPDPVDTGVWGLRVLCCTERVENHV